MLNGGKVEPRNEYEHDAIQDYSDIYMMEAFGWSYEDIMKMPSELYQRAILFISKRNVKEQQDAKAKAKAR